MQKQPIVLDNGSGTIRFGRAGEDYPTITLTPSQYQNQCQSKSPLDSDFPIKRSIVQDWDRMMNIWDHGFKQLKAEPSQQPILITDAINNPLKSREQMAEVMFQSYDVPAFYVENKALLSMYSGGRCTAFIVYSGDGVTYTLPNFQGRSIIQNVQRVDFGGSDIQHYLRCLIEKGPGTGINLNMTQIKTIKEKLCCIPAFQPSTLNENSIKNDRYFQLPDGSQMLIGQQALGCGEVMFAPSKHPAQYSPKITLQDLITQSISKCEYYLRPDFYSNIVLSGGNTLLQNFRQRLQQQLLAHQKSPLNIKKHLKISKYPQRNYMSWIGGSILASLSSFQQHWITKEQYMEQGRFVVRRR